MAMELGLHEELTENQHVENTSEKLVNQEIRRGLFWTVYSIDRISSAATGRPSVIQDNSCSVFLPGKVDQDKENQYYSETLDNNRHIFLNVNGFRKSYLLGAYNLGTVPLNDDIGTFQYLSHFAYFIRAIKLLGRVTNYVNQKGKGGQSDLPPYHPDSEFTKLDQDIDNWQNQLPMHLKNTLTNLELDKNIEPTNSNQQLFIIHILYNTIIVLLHRPSLVMMDTLNNDAIQPVIKEFVRKSVNKCMAAVDNVTNLLRLGRNRKELLPPYITYFIYTVATVVVSTLFSPRPEEAQKAKQALGVYFELLLTARNYWAMADKLYFMIRDLYALHINVLKRYQTNRLLVAQQEPQMQQSTLPVYSQQHMNALDMSLPGNINDSLSDWTLSYYNAAMSTETPEVGLMNDQDQNMLFSTNFFQIPKNYDQSLFFSTFTPVNSDINSNNL
ncbi:uncharacterized protein BX663DRAFT_529917 [Cokeromyces recurvatus]|uniref:uncharacterized protein n=1 Tax=Cokeromyces recurvatus TaxID=90255 RepID=UPI00221FB865|nr:uncharacterized protein BX663DRAFT_529917 [Cokeromyces recurvatus]KAI7905016.1 hypothetical protein BX663DRAFT_529917 [Cokeromyces recurvatus]